MEWNPTLLYTASDQGASLNYPCWDLAETYIMYLKLKTSWSTTRNSQKHLILHALQDNGWIETSLTSTHGLHI